MRHGIAPFAFLLAACSSSEEPRADPDSSIECNGIADCQKAVDELRQADRVMQREFENAILRVRACEHENTTRCSNFTRAIALVETEHTSWLAWRIAHCETFAFSMENTSAEGLLEAVCRADLAKTRTTELRDIMSPESSD